MQISCDGGAATGKSTGAKMIAKKYNLKFLSSGLLYRYASYLILKFKPRNRISFLKRRFKKLNYYQLNKINLNNPKISEHSASIAKINKIRAILKKYQLNFSKKHKNCCIEGRDISTKILPKSCFSTWRIYGVKFPKSMSWTVIFLWNWLYSPVIPSICFWRIWTKN